MSPMNSNAAAVRNHGPTLGFTLLEVLVAIAIFAIAAQLTFGGLRNILAGREKLLPRHDAAAELRYAVSMLSQDLVAVAPRAVRDALGDPAPALVAGGRPELIAFTRYDAARAALVDTVGVFRVSYMLKDGVLERDIWPVLDVVQSTKPVSQPLLRGLRKVRLRFLDSADVENGWTDIWPASNGAGSLSRLPRAIEFELEFEDGRSLRRVLIPGAST